MIKIPLNMMASHGWVSGGHGFQISHRNTLPHSTFSQSANRPGISMVADYAFSTVVLSLLFLGKRPVEGAIHVLPAFYFSDADAVSAGLQ